MVNRYSIATALVVTTLALMPATALAQSPLPVRERSELRAEEIRANGQARQEERQENRQERRDERFENHAKRLETRFSNYSERLNALLDKIQARLNEMEQKFPDSSAIDSAQVKLDAASAKLAEAEKAGNAAVAGFKAIDPAKYEEQKAQVLVARDNAQKARQAYADALRLMKEAVQSLKQVK